MTDAKTSAASKTSPTKSELPLFLRAAGGEKTERPPLWVMRQAGRYLPEYRALRKEHDFLTVCRTPELACEVTLQPLRRFAFDAAIVFSDIMMPLERMGVDLAFDPGPKIARPVRTRADVERLVVPEGPEIAPAVYESIRLLRRELKVPLIGFAGAPWTLAAYLVEGGGSKDFAKVRELAAQAPEILQALLDKLALQTSAYLREQVRAGAQAVQLFDSWAGLLGVHHYEQLALPVVKKIMANLADLKVPRIYFANDAAHLMPTLHKLDCEVVGVDWRQPLHIVRAQLRDGVALQGNLDPARLFAKPSEVRREVVRVLDEGRSGPHIFNLGHGILPTTPLEGVEALVETVHQARPIA